MIRRSYDPPAPEKAVVIVRSNAIHPNPRVEKAAEYLSGHYQISILGWDRTRQAAKLERRPEYTIHRCHLKGQYGSGTRNIFGLTAWAIYEFVWLLTHKFDVVHACDFDSYFSALLAAKVKRKRIVYDICDFYADSIVRVPRCIKGAIARIDIALMKYADGVILPDESRRVQISGAKVKRLQDIYNVPPDRYHNDWYRARVSSSKTAFTLGYVGVIQRERSLSMLMDITASLSQVRLIVGGFGSRDYEEELRDKARTLANVDYLGRVAPYERTLDVLASSDALFALYDPDVPNHRYSSPNKLFEAMMLAKPIIVSRGTGMDRWVEQFVCGICVDYGNERQLRNAILKLRDMKHAGVNTYGENGRQAYLTTFHPDTMRSRLVRFYESLLCQ
jgi:glycosyltransferase involved in cell wall biosynthesis